MNFGGPERVAASLKLNTGIGAGRQEALGPLARQHHLRTQQTPERVGAGSGCIIRAAGKGLKLELLCQSLVNGQEHILPVCACGIVVVY